MNKKYTFPFGEQLQKVEQKDKTPKKAFVLGVYASAVHARWVDKNGKQKVLALAVASEPNIFWTGENAAGIIGKINIPKELGTLTVPSNTNLNGPSGRALDKLYLKPLGLNRQNTWLCDLLPYSRVNLKQREALNKNYTSELIETHNLPIPNIPDFDKAELNSEKRREEILNELIQSKADTLILLGDEPIRWFLSHYTNNEYKKLSDFGKSTETYGLKNEITIQGQNYNVIALCHPRQAGRLGTSSANWGNLHDAWVKRINNNR